MIQANMGNYLAVSTCCGDTTCESDVFKELRRKLAMIMGKSHHKNDQDPSTIEKNKHFKELKMKVLEASYTSNTDTMFNIIKWCDHTLLEKMLDYEGNNLII